jgi:XTP/dITP diphosphohydrolase
MISKLLIASNNKGKIREINELLQSFNIQILTTENLNFDEPEETGKTFAENAIIKAKYYANLTQIPSLSDDSGLCVDALDGSPGIYSARWAGENKDFKKAIKRVENELIEKTGTNKGHKAHFICVLCLYLPNNKYYTFEGRIDGILTFPPKGENGFGYDSIFIAQGMNKTYGEISQKEKNSLNHRSIAFNKFKHKFEELVRINDQHC